LRAAEAHIARLEEELVRLKDVKRDLQALREEHRQLRRSAQGRVAKILSAPFRLLRSAKSAPVELTPYERWLAQHRVTADQLPRLGGQARAFPYQPLVSILTPTWNANETYLSVAIESVRAQVYANWELIVVDDGSQNPSPALAQFTGDSRIRVLREKEHGGISAALNVALAHARGEWLALLDHDDLLEPDALFRAIEWLQKDRLADVIYSDEDKIIDDHFAAPMLKPDWSPEFFLTHDYLGHFVVIRRELIDQFRSQFDGAQDYDLLLRISEKTDRIRHIPRVLYHWRRTGESTAHNIRRKPGALEAGRTAIAEYLQRRGDEGRVTVDWETHVYRVRRESAPARVSIVLHNGDAESSSRIRERTSYPDFEIITEAKTIPETAFILFLDGDLEPIQENWLSILMEFARSREIGAVGPRIVSVDDSVESAGLILLPQGKIGPAFAGMPRDFRGASRQLQMVRNYSAVSGSCLLVRRDVLEKVAPGAAVQSLNGVCRAVEISLKLGDAGLRVVSVPYAEMRRTSRREPISESCPELAQRWADVFARDPFYNPNLSRERADFSLGDPQHE
jgi:glycosyltransferase involved in cell wall biosynthesis